MNPARSGDSSGRPLQTGARRSHSGAETGPSAGLNHGAHRRRLIIVPVTLRVAAAFITRHHRHLAPPRGHRFSSGVATGDYPLVGVVVVGRPVARAYDYGFTAEVSRLCTDGTPNGCSALLGAARHAVSTVGHRRLIIYTRAGEPGTSLCAAGWQRIATRPPNAGRCRPSPPRIGHGTHYIALVLWQAPLPTRHQGGSR